ncbi:hypothetical protein K440DRAFT_632993 [Wilcoxina mikolae CBS 423.85]|nr:hypothetical protein K440DRAFT_632993 [Wilcoxina mikolae CBS 423.85]
MDPPADPPSIPKRKTTGAATAAHERSKSLDMPLHTKREHGGIAKSSPTTSPKKPVTSPRKFITSPMKSVTSPQRLAAALQNRMRDAWRRTADSQTGVAYKTFPTVEEVTAYFGTNYNRTLYSSVAEHEGLPLHIAETGKNYNSRLFRHPICRFYPDAPPDPAEWIKADEDPYAYMALQIDTTPPNETRFLLSRKNGETLTTEQRGRLQITNQRSMRNHRDDGKVEVRTYRGHGVCGGIPFCYKQTQNCVSGVEMNEEELKHHYSTVHKLQVEAFIDIEGEFDQEDEQMEKQKREEEEAV